MIHHDQGLLSFENQGPYGQYQFAIKDHLSNTRVLFADINNNGSIDYTTEILNQSEYYPFGMEKTGSWQKPSTYDYRYNGKELEEAFGLNWYNYGARFYDGAIGRFVSVDALADDPIQVDKSTYAYTWNNPINHIDPDGNIAFVITAIIAVVEAVAAAITVETVVATSVAVGVVVTANNVANNVTLPLTPASTINPSVSFPSPSITDNPTSKKITDFPFLEKVIMDGGIVYSKTPRRNHRDDSLRDLTDDDLTQELGKLKGQLNKVQKALKQRLQKEEKIRRLRNKQKKNSENGAGTGRK